MQKKHIILIFFTLLTFIIGLAVSSATLHFDIGNLRINTVEDRTYRTFQGICDDKNLYFAWQDSRNYTEVDKNLDIYVRRYNAETNEWNDEVKLNAGLTDNERNFIQSFCTGKNGNIYITWTAAYGTASSYSKGISLAIRMTRAKPGAKKECLLQKKI